MTPMMKRENFELGSWQPIKPTANCKPNYEPNKFIITTR